MQALLSEIPSHWFEVHANFSRQAVTFLWHGLASSTHKSYSTGQRSFIDFARLHPGLLDEPGKFLPATPRVIVEWVASLGACALQPKTIKSYLSTVRSLHVDEGLPFDACESETVR